MRGLFSIHKMLKTVFSSLIVTTLFSCAVYPDVNRDPAKNNKETFQRDAVDCAQAYPEAASGVHVKQRIGCMNLKGWY